MSKKITLKGSGDLSMILNHCRHELPIEALRVIKDWNFIQKSPYSLSLYDKPKDWNDALPNTIRIADHWNFFSRGRMHCQTSSDVPNDTHWCIAIFDDSIKKFVPILIIEKRPKTKAEQVEAEMILLDALYKKALVRAGDEYQNNIEFSFLKKKYQILEQLHG